MAGTNYSNGGFRRISRLVPQVRVRVAGFALVVICGTILLAWITNSIWRQLDRLQKEHAAVKSESFYLGVHLRGTVRSLNDKLLQFGVSHDPTFRAAFLSESTELNEWIATNQLHLAEMANLQLLKTLEVSHQLEILRRAETSYHQYLTNALSILTETNTASGPGAFEAVYKQVREASSSLFPLCDALVKAQRQGFSEFLGETQGTLVNHQRLLQLSSALILGLALALAVVVYRGMIAPLRVGLSESTSIIERQEKLASLGILASGVAHEIRNPLTAIKFRLFSLRKSVPSVVQNEDATVIGNEINRLEGIVQDFLQFARPAEPRLARIPAGQILREVYDLLGSQLERSAIVLKLENHETAMVHADAQQMKQVLINLIQNSAENIGRNGTVTLRLRRGTAELDGRTRPAAILVVADTGKGIPPEVERRLFDPFFTTKEESTGLGLAISARIVEKHGGLLRYETELNHGTTFEIVLPGVADDASEHTVN
ncbi:MAG: ATP-binding protein [Verrucomicrobiales bacterium]|nr:ATP-binding protein [Verrucomicrobiales bacterium]